MRVHRVLQLGGSVTASPGMVAMGFVKYGVCSSISVMPTSSSSSPDNPVSSSPNPLALWGSMDHLLTCVSVVATQRESHDPESSRARSRTGCSSVNSNTPSCPSEKERD